MCPAPFHDLADRALELERALRDLVNTAPWWSKPQCNCPWCEGDEAHYEACALSRARAALSLAQTQKGGG